MALTGNDHPPDLEVPDEPLPSSGRNFLDKAQEDNDTLTPSLAQRVGMEIYESSTSWLNAGRRSKWNDSLRAFQGLHPTGSKYLTRDYVYRSNLFRPKTRSMVRNDEAQTAAAFFANQDVVSITPGDEDDPVQKASADMMQQLLQYRLTKTIPWFLTVTGARQDAEVQGICVGRVGWKYEEEFSHTEHEPVLGPDGLPSGDTRAIDIMRKVTDEPFVNLLAPENVRFEPGADWRDVVGTSPYFVELIPMYLDDVEERIRSGEWFKVPSSSLRKATDRSDDVTRRSREAGRVPGKDSDTWKPRTFDIVWIRRNIVRWRGEDQHFYSLSGAGELLSDPQPLHEVELHGERPYVVGFVVLETHKTYPSSKVEITSDLQRAANDDWNLRFDNVKLSLNPRQFVRAGYGMENQDLTRFAPGKVVTVNAKAGEQIEGNIVTWDRPPPPDASAYEEQNRINLDWDELAGAFNPASVQASQLREAPATGMHLLSGISSGINEYELRIFAETFVEKILRLLVKVEQAYETDPVVLALAGRKAQLFQKYGLNHITDELLGQELTTQVNVGIGATNPSIKLRNALGMAQAVGSIFGPIAAQKLDFDEVFKELAGLSGYKDGKRFIKPGDSVQEMQLKQQLQQLMMKGKGATPQQPPDTSKVDAARITAQSRIMEQMLQNENDKRSDEMDLRQELIGEHGENYRAGLKFAHDRQMAMHSQAHDARMAGASQMHEMRQGMMQQQSSETPPAHMLAEGRVRTFGNGQRWTMRQGKGVRVG